MIRQDVTNSWTTIFELEEIVVDQVNASWHFHIKQVRPTKAWTYYTDMESQVQSN